MSSYRNECADCGDSYITEAWEPERCPFCEVCDLRDERNAAIARAERAEIVFANACLASRLAEARAERTRSELEAGVARETARAEKAEAERDQAVVAKLALQERGTINRALHDRIVERVRTERDAEYNALSRREAEVSALYYDMVCQRGEARERAEAAEALAASRPEITPEACAAWKANDTRAVDAVGRALRAHAAKVSPCLSPEEIAAYQCVLPEPPKGESR